MKTIGKKFLASGCLIILFFIIWTLVLLTVDVRPAGVNGTDIGFAAVNTYFHSLTGVNMTLYTVTDWLGLVPLFICVLFGTIGFIQLIKRRNLFKVDRDILILGVYYIIVMLCYFIFETIPVNYRPVLIDGIQEISYPSSTTLLVLSVMLTLSFQTGRRLKGKFSQRLIRIAVTVFSAFMVTARLISGVHWLSDIIGALLLSTGLYLLYKGAVLYREN